MNEHRQPWSPPLLRWAGSKRKLLPTLLECVPSRLHRYIEPFAGSACLFFALRPDCAVLGDTNAELLQTYSILQKHPRLVAQAVHSWPNTETSYYSIRRQSPDDLNPIDRAARFIYLNRYCFNGVYRTNRRGEFNVPRGIRTGAVPSESAFYRCSIALRNARVRAVDFEDCLQDVRTGDFVYLDPPYTSVSRNRYGEYGYGCFGDCDIDRLVLCLRRIDGAGAMFLLSYANTCSVAQRLSRWYQRIVRVRRHVAGFAGDRAEVSELLVSNCRI